MSRFHATLLGALALALLQVLTAPRPAAGRSSGPPTA